MRSVPSEHVSLLAYDRSEQPDVSDHKPVFAYFRTKVRVVIKERQAEIYREVMRKLDNWENQNIPKVHIDRSVVNLGPVRYSDKASASFSIENVGQVVAHFRFIPKLEEKAYCKVCHEVEKFEDSLFPDFVMDTFQSCRSTFVRVRIIKITFRTNVCPSASRPSKE